MTAIKVSSKVEAQVWRELRQLAQEKHQSISGVLTEAIREYVGRRRVRPEVLCAMEQALTEHAELGRRLAR